MRPGHYELASVYCTLRGERLATKEEIAIIVNELKGILKQAF
jgi:hypothetical protein